MLTRTAADRITRIAGELLPFGRERLRTYALAESPTGDREALGTFAELVMAGHVEAGGHPARVPGPSGDHVVTSFGPDAEAGSGQVVVLGHIDTVWPVGRLASMPYDDDGNRIAGPGVFDMKGGLVVLEMALRTLDAAGIPPAQPLRAILVADEEIGSPEGRRLVLDELTGAVVALGLEPPHPDGALKTGRRGSARVRIRVTGREAHAANDPDKGISAIDELLDQLATVRAGIPGDGSVLFNIGRLSGGTRANVVAGEASAEIGMRFSDPDGETRALAELTALGARRSGATVETIMLSSRPTWVAPAVNPLLDAVTAMGELLGQRVAGRPANGAGDTNFAGSGGVPALDGFGPNGRGAHAPDEAVRVDSLSSRAALLAAVLATPAPVPGARV